MLLNLKDPKVELARQLRTLSGRKSHQKILLEGKEAIQWAPSLEYVIATERFDPSFIHTLQAPVFFTTEGILKKITETSFLIPIIGVTSKPHFSPLTSDIVLVLDGVKDHGNIGCLARTLWGLGFSDILSSDQEADLYFRKTIDASRGTVFKMNYQSLPSQVIYELLKKEGYSIGVTTVQESTLQPFVEVQSGKIALVLGNESQGVSPFFLEKADFKIKIPMITPLDSYNVAVSGSMSLYELKTKVILAMLIQKIQKSLGRNLSVLHLWSRHLFNQALQEGTPYCASHAILMMMLHCEGSVLKETLQTHSQLPIEDFQKSLSFLEKKGIIQGTDTLSITAFGETELSKIWLVHEKIEEQLFNGFSADQKRAFLLSLGQMIHNCEKIAPFPFQSP